MNSPNSFLYDFPPSTIVKLPGRDKLLAVLADLSEIGKTALLPVTKNGDRFEIESKEPELIDCEHPAEQICRIPGIVSDEYSEETRIAHTVQAQILGLGGARAFMRWNRNGANLRQMTVEHGGCRMGALVIGVAGHRLLDVGTVAIALDRGADEYVIQFRRAGELLPFHEIPGVYFDNMIEIIDRCLDQTAEELARD